MYVSIGAMDKAEAKLRAQEIKREDPKLCYRVERLPKGDYGVLVWEKNPMGWGYLEYDMCVGDDGR